MAKKKTTENSPTVNEHAEGYVSPWITAAQAGEQVSYSTDEESEED